jgi:hypothetical protein
VEELPAHNASVTLEEAKTAATSVALGATGATCPLSRDVVALTPPLCRGFNGGRGGSGVE